MSSSMLDMFLFFHYNILLGGKWYLIVVFICISLMANIIAFKKNFNFSNNEVCKRIEEIIDNIMETFSSFLSIRFNVIN